MTPADFLVQAYHSALDHLAEPFITESLIAARAEIVCRNLQNRAGVRLLLACLLAKLDNPAVDIRKPYTEIGDADAFSGRTYDERYITPFVLAYKLPCNPTTAFLTPALRNRNTVLTPDLDMVGRPKEVYQAALQLLKDVYAGRVEANVLLLEIIRLLILVREERHQRMNSLLHMLEASRSSVGLPAETIITLIQQHLAFRGASRLPVLAVAAAYHVAGSALNESALPLEAHTAADRQTHALGDVQIVSDEQVIVACYEMKMKQVTITDIDQTMLKVAQAPQPPQHYVFITTETILPEVNEYARQRVSQTGIEVVVLDCIGFLRHFLHLFYQQRMAFLEAYQELVLSEPDSAISPPLKEAFLALRHAAESE
ncbi:MAG: DNA methyltransferase [Chloroflexota bacterium]|nr:MAG: DNA methyltransferase [Chloroflexota bacterium]